MWATRPSLEPVGCRSLVRAFARMAHLSDDEAVAKMGHPIVWFHWATQPTRSNE